MGRPVQLIPIGTVFTRLTVLGPGPMRGRNHTSLCRCKCGTEKYILNLCLKSKKSKTQSCGCLASEKASRRAIETPPRLKHGGAIRVNGRQNPTYASWVAMLTRCHDEKCSVYHRYGGFGIVVCDRWRDPDHGYQCFLEDMGERPSRAYSIDRIAGSKVYSKETCRWATRDQQNRNVGLKKSNTSGYKGINKHGSGWTVEIRMDEGKKYIGLYKTKEEAAYAYNLASEKFHGEFGWRNELPEMEKAVKDGVKRKLSKFF